MYTGRKRIIMMFIVKGISPKDQYNRCKATGFYGRNSLICMRKVNSAWMVEARDSSLVYENFRDCSITEISGKNFEYEASWEKEHIYDIVNLIRAIGGKVTSVSECYDRVFVTAEIPVEYKMFFQTAD